GPAPGPEHAPVDYRSSCAFRPGGLSGSVELPLSAEQASRFVAPPESGPPAELRTSLASRLSSGAEPPWNHRLPSGREKRLRLQPQGSVRPRPGSNKSSAGAERWPFRGLPFARLPAAESSVSRPSAGRSAPPGATAQRVRELAARKRVP